jgi:hypothetical protein
MWVYLNNAFLSLVIDKDNPRHLLVRARHKGDLERTFRTRNVRRTPDGDYLYRTSIHRRIVAKVIADAVLGIKYPNFKNSVHDGSRHDAYARCWSEMLMWQKANEPSPEPRVPPQSKPRKPGPRGRSLRRER